MRFKRKKYVQMRKLRIIARIHFETATCPIIEIGDSIP